ncbi:PA14 domain-containing protein [Coraliomargarita sp. W4R72]
MKITSPYFLAHKYTKLSIGLSLLFIASFAQAAHREIEQDGSLIFGLDPSWNSGSEFDKALDGDASTYYDYAYDAVESYVGLDFGAQAIPVEIHFTARKGFSRRMIGGQFQASSESTTAGFETIYEISSDPGEEAQVVTLSTSAEYRYYRYLAPADAYGNIAEFSIVAVETDDASSLSEAPDGFVTAEVNGVAVFGLDPAWRSGREFDKAFDANADSYYDYKYADRESFLGFDHGESAVPTAIHYTPRARYAARMVGGRFEGSNESAYSGYEIIFNISETPVEAAQTVSLNTSKSYRYYRYVAPVGSYGNIAEFSMDLVAPSSAELAVDAPAPSAPEIAAPVAPEIAAPVAPEIVTPVVPEIVTPVEPEPEPEPEPELPAEPINYPDGYRENNTEGTILFGLDPAWSSGREFENAFDGNPATYYDYKYSDSEAFLGMDAGEAIIPEQIVFQAREKFSKRMIGGRFEASKLSSVSGYETIHEVTTDPTASVQVIELNTDEAYRYFRYVAAVGSFGNIAEFSVSGDAPLAPVSEQPNNGDNANEDDGNDDVTAPGEISDTFLTTATVDGQAGVLLSFTLEQSQMVSAAIYNQNDQMVRTLLEGAQLEAGLQELVWDGLDRDGHSVPQDTYTLKVIKGKGLSSEYVTSLGVNPNTEAYDTWVGNHDGAASVAIDSTGMYVAAQITETAPVLLKQSLDGSVRYWMKTREDVTVERFQGGVALASDDNGKLFMLQQNGYLQVIDTETGKLMSSWDVLPSSEVREMWNYQHVEMTADADLAAYGDALVLSFSRDDLLQWRDPSNGQVLTELTIPSPRGVAVINSNEILVASAGDVYRVDRNGSAILVISSELSDPQRISIDRSNNTILVTDGYADSQVKRFSFAGELLATHGRPGGRLDGAYVATDFHEVSDIVADGAGGFLITEPLSGARRVAHFNRSGSVINEWFGGQSYYAWAEPDPRDPTQVWYYTGDGLVLAELDVNGQSWSVKETWATNDLANGLIEQVAGHVASWRVLYQGEQRYLVSERNPQVLAHSDGKLRAVSISSDSAIQMARAREITGYTSEAKVFRWLDANGDGEPQNSEFTFTPHYYAPRGKTITDDFTLITFDRFENEMTVNRTEAIWGANGPYYPIGRESGINEVMASAATESHAALRGTGSYMSSEGDYYAHYNLANEAHGVFWPTDWSGVSRFVKLDTEGNEMWRVGRHAYQGGLAGLHSTTYIDTPAGQLHVPVKVIGEVEDAIVLADRVENPALAWTKDGLYLGSFFDNHADDGLPETVYTFFATEDGSEAITASDNASGGRVIRYEDGSVLWFAQGRNSVPVYKVTGWDGFVRQEASFQLNTAPDSAVANGTGLSVEYFTGEIDHSASVTGIETMIWNGVPVDGEGYDYVIDGLWGNVNDWSQGPELLSQHTDFSARWKGELEAPVSEDFIFSIYTRGGVRLWINGHLILNSWNEIIERFESAPVRFVAGERYSIQLDYNTSQAHPSLSLNWESRSFDRARIPSEYLYPVVSHPTYEVITDATDYITASSFAIESGVMSDSLMDEYSVRGYRQWGFGTSGAYLGYTDIDFSEGVSSLQVEASGRPSVSRNDFPVTLEFRLDSPSGRLLASVNLDSELQTYTLPVSSVTGVHDIYVVNVTTEEWHHIDFRGFEFQ